MEQIPEFTPEQQIIISNFIETDYLRSNFYFTGGTALSNFYLHHRYSDDLDFFSTTKFENQVLLTLIEEWSKKNDFTFTSRFIEVTYIFQLKFTNLSDLKVDFSYYPYKQIHKPVIHEGISTDSLTDIAVNKLLTISQRTEVKDFVDLYFLLDHFSLYDLIEGVKQKFHQEIDTLLLAADFLKVEDFMILPRMKKGLQLAELKLFYRDLAKKLGMNSVD